MRIFDVKSKEDHFKDIIGYDDIKGELERIIDVMNNREKYEKLGATIPRNILLDGEPGTGKTTIANDFLAAVNRKVYIIRKDLSNGEFLNGIKKTFTDAKENAPSIVLLDDLDKFANADSERPNSEEYITVQSCIDDVKNSDVFVFATTNDIHMLPLSLRRAGRFDKKLNVEMPSGEDRKKIIKYYISNKKINKNINLDAVIRILSNLSGASIESIINIAGVEAGYRNSETINLEDIVIAKLKVEYNVRIGVKETEENNWRRAYHEAGHTVLASLFFPNNITYSTILTGKSGGVTSYETPKNIAVNLKIREQDMIVGLGGKVATELVYGDKDLGVNGDLNSLFYKVGFLVGKVCTKGFDKFMRDRNNSNDLLYRREQAEYEIINNAYEKAKKIIIDNREFLDKIAKELYENQVLIYTEIDKIKSTCKIVEPSF